MFGYYLRRVDQRCSPCEFEQIWRSFWTSVTFRDYHFGPLWLCLASPPVHFAKSLYDNLWIQSECSQCSCLASQDRVRDAQYHTIIVQYDTVRRIQFNVYLRGTHCTCISDFGKSPHASWVPSSGSALLFLLPVAGELITCLNRGTADFTPPTDRSLWTEFFQEILYKNEVGPIRLFTSLCTIIRKGPPRLMFSNPWESVYTPKATESNTSTRELKITTDFFRHGLPCLQARQ